MNYRWSSSSRTDRGRRRPTNEDAVLELPESGLWVVADGMGGHTRGDLASRWVVEAFEDLGRSRRLPELIAKARLRIHQANERIYQHAQSMGAGTTIGCTTAVLLASRHQFACLWVGDSRIYRLRDGVLEQLTRDHSLIQEMLDRGDIAPEEAAGHPAARRITRAVGALPSVRVDQLVGELRHGDRFLICSDGLPLEVADDEIASTLSLLDRQAGVDSLLDLALQRGARDNVSLAVVEFEERPGLAYDEDSTAVNEGLPYTSTSTTSIDTLTTLTSR